MMDQTADRPAFDVIVIGASFPTMSEIWLELLAGV